MFHGSVQASLLAQAGTGTPPAGGAALGQIAIASVAATLLTVALLWVGTRHREGRTNVLTAAGTIGERITGLPGWVAFPGGVATASLITAVFGMYWDISLHIGVGRDEGPLANPAHYFILAGLFGIFTAGYLAMVMPEGEPSASSLRITEDWHAPLGGVLICACGAFSLIGFPLDDVWHRIFGQDVTLWGPTHLMLIGGAAMTLVGIAVLMVEGLRTLPEQSDGRTPRLHWSLALPLGGGLLLGLSTFQAEFDFGVPQFRFVFQPILIMLAASIGLVAIRLFGGRGAALGAVGFFIIVRGALTLLVDPVLGQSTPHFPLYLAEAALVEGVALAIPRTRPLAFGLTSGVLIGTVGLAAEWGWSHVWMPLPWPAELLPEAAGLGFASAVAGGLLGAWVGARLTTKPGVRSAPLRVGALIGAAAVSVIVASTLYKPADEGVRASVQLTQLSAGGGGADRTVRAVVQLDPATAADDAEWLTATAWQGGGLDVDHLRRIGPGRYVTTQPLPVSGNWKSLIRLHHGRSLTALPVYLPDDPAIPAKGVPASSSSTRSFAADHTILQREQKSAASWLTVAAYLVVVLIALGLLALLTWGLHRLSLGDAMGTGAGGTSRRGARSAARTHAPGGAQVA